MFFGYLCMKKAKKAKKSMTRPLLTLILMAVTTATAAGATQPAVTTATPQPAPTATALPVPRADDSYWRDSIPATMRQSYIAYGERYLGQPWTVLPWTLFAENKKSGNRVRYEAACFEKRRQLAALVMAEVAEGKGRFVPDIVNGLGALCEESWWGIPAHYNKAIPLTGQQEVDLFNAETASLMAWTAYMLRTQLDAFSPEVCRRIEGEVERRLLKPVLAKNYWWKTAGMNWNPWICSNWLTCVLLCDHDEARRLKAIGQIAQATEAFINAYPADGGCDEGPGYWDRAAASLFEVLSLLDTVAPTLPDSVRADLDRRFTPRRAKIEAMGSYVYKTYIGSDYCVNFADTHDNKMLQQLNVVYPFALWLGDATMRQFAAYMAREKDLLHQAATLYDKSGNFPTLGRELRLLRHVGQLLGEQPREPLVSDVWLPDLQLMTARRGPLFVAMKGGTNGESHNHNDVGSFIVYTTASNQRGEPAGTTATTPLLIDPGVGEYTAATFSGDRYTIWTMQSGYHNLPQVNGCDQRDGKQYHATVSSHAKGRLTLELAGAYGKEAAIRSWRRTVECRSSAVSVTEAYELAQWLKPTRLMLMTTATPDVSQPGTVRLGQGHAISYDPRQLSAEAEDISPRLDGLLQGVWGRQMWRVVLTVKGTRTKGTIRYSIR